VGPLWFFVNVLLPLVLPILGPLPILATPSIRAVAGITSLSRLILITVKDGQLGWGAVAMGLSTLYELLQHVRLGQDVTLGIIWAVFAAVVIMIFAAVPAAVGAYFPVAIASPVPVTLAAWVRHYLALSLSMAAAIVNASAFTYVHFQLAS